MPQLLPRSVFFYHADWVAPAGRLIWATLFATISLLWIMMLMKKAAVKHKFLGPVFLIVGTSIGALMVLSGKTVLHSTLVGNTFVPMGFMIAWFCFLGGIWTIFLSIEFEQAKIGVSKKTHVLITILMMAAVYTLGGFIHPITIPMLWLNVFILLVSISLFFWSAPKRVDDATWVGAIIGGLASFALMGFIYAIIPHEFITFANGYLQWTKDVKLSPGGEFVLKTWMSGHLWKSNTRVLPFEVNMEMVQDNVTIAIYVICAIVNIKLFATWQKRNEPKSIKQQDQVSVQRKSIFGRPLKSMKMSEA